MLNAGLKASGEVDGSADEEHDSTARMLALIQDYNAKSAPEDQVKFMTGSSSAVLTVVGTQTQFFNYKSQQTITATVPFSLIPTGDLRKKYGVYPFCGELEFGVFGEGARKRGISYDHISGVAVNSLSSIKKACGYATRAPTPRFYRQQMVDLITISEERYKTRLKKLMMCATNFMLVECADQKKIPDYVELLKLEYVNLTKQFPDDEEIKRCFDKYIPRFADILTGKNVPFKAGAAFISEISNQYPVVYCSTALSKKFSGGIKDEFIHKGNISLDTVKLLFTPKSQITILESKVSELKLKAKVYALPEEKSLPNPFEESKSLLDAYFKEDKTDALAKLYKLLHSDEYEKFDRQHAIALTRPYYLLAKKIAIDSEYLSLASRYANEDLLGKYARMKKILYLYHYYELRKRGNQGFVNYDHPISNITAMIDKIINAKDFSFENIRTQHKLNRLENLCFMLMLDKAEYPAKSVYINQLIEAVKDRFQKIYHEEVDSIPAGDVQYIVDLELYKTMSKEHSHLNLQNK